MIQKIGLFFVYCLVISGCTTSKIESDFTPSPDAAPIEEESKAETLPTGFYLCKNTAYQYSEYSFTLYPQGKYTKQDSKEAGTYSYSVSENGVVSIEWQGVYSFWDNSIYRENQGKKIIVLSSHKESDYPQVCQLEAS